MFNKKIGCQRSYSMLSMRKKHRTSSFASIAAQTFLPSEVILVDDCSGDDTLQKLTHIKNSYPDNWIKV